MFTHFIWEQSVAGNDQLPVAAAATRSMKRLPLVITRSPGARPSSTSTMRAVGEPDLDLAQFDRGIVVARNPHPGALALVDDGVARDRNRGFAFAGEDLHAGEHFRLEHSGGVVDGRPHQQAARGGIERGRHIGNLGREGAIRIGQDGEIDRLADAHHRRLGLADIGDHPDGRQIADDENGVAGAAADILPGPDLALDDRPADRGIDGRGRVDRALGLEFGDLLVGLAENAQPVARRFQRHIGGAHIVFSGVERALGLLHFLERDGLALVEQALPLVVDLREIERRAGFVQRGRGADEVVLRLHHVGGFDREQRLPRGYDLAGLDEQLGDPAGIGREDRRGAVLVDGDLAFGHVFGAECLLLAGFHCQRRPLRGGRIEQPPRPLRLARDCGVHVGGFAGRLRLHRPDHGGAGNDERHDDQRLHPR